MSEELITIDCPTIPRGLRQYRGEQRWVSYIPGQPIGELSTYEVALRQAIAEDAVVAFVPEGYSAETAPSKHDYSAPVPSVLSRKKRTT